MSWAIQLLIAMAIGGSGFYAGAEWHAGRDAVAAEKKRSEIAEQVLVDLKQIDKSAAGLESDKENIKIVYRTITKEVERVVQKPFYITNDLCLDDDGLRAIAQAGAASVAAPSKPAPAVRAASETR